MTRMHSALDDEHVDLIAASKRRMRPRDRIVSPEADGPPQVGYRFPQLDGIHCHACGLQHFQVTSIQPVIAEGDYLTCYSKVTDIVRIVQLCRTDDGWELQIRREGMT